MDLQPNLFALKTKAQQKAHKASFRSGRSVLEPPTLPSQWAHKLTAFFFWGRRKRWIKNIAQDSIPVTAIYCSAWNLAPAWQLCVADYHLWFSN